MESQTLHPHKMADEAKLQDEMMAKLKEIEKMQQKMEEIKKKSKAYEYKGPQLKVKVEVADQTFMSSTKVLCNKANGNTLFMRQILGLPDDDDEELKNEGNESQQIAKAPKNGSCIDIYFDRDPDVFPLILSYLRGYNMDYTLHNCSVETLQTLYDDAVYYRVKGLIKSVHDRIHKRFDPKLCSPLIELSKNGMSATRIAANNSLHVSCGVYGVLRKGRRYVEFELVSHGNRYIMLGVAEADNYKFSPYPGQVRCTGCSYYATNGHLYRNGGSEAWGAALSHGDQIGVLVDISEDQDTATIAFYVNGKLVKNAVDLTAYMNIRKGVVFVGNMYSSADQILIVQCPKVPK